MISYTHRIYMEFNWRDKFSAWPKRDLYFIDYTKEFDKVRCRELLEILGNLDLFGKNIRIIQNLYWQQIH